jgi:hypothetical protein
MEIISKETMEITGTVLVFVAALLMVVVPALLLIHTLREYKEFRKEMRDIAQRRRAATK